MVASMLSLEAVQRNGHDKHLRGINFPLYMLDHLQEVSGVILWDSLQNADSVSSGGGDLYGKSEPY